MSQWDADLDRALMGPGAKVTVQSEHQVVRILAADTLMIETPAGQRFPAVVVDRKGGALQLVLPDGRSFSLAMLLDESLYPPAMGSTAFSRQVWRTH